MCTGVRLGMSLETHNEKDIYICGREDRQDSLKESKQYEDLLPKCFIPPWTSK